MKDSNEYKVYRYWSPSGKSYIGQTNQSIAARSGSRGQQYHASTKFYNAIQKYGFDWFKQHCEILADDLKKEEANFLEKKYIRQYDSIENGYNIQSGGTFNPVEICGRKIVGINCNTKEICFYPSVTEAARQIGNKVSRRSIEKLITHENPTQKTMGGYVWIAEEEWNILSRKEKEDLKSITPNPKNLSRAVICLNNLKVFSSIKEAQVYYGINNIGICCRGKIKTCGKLDGIPLRWAYYDEYVKEGVRT